MTRLWWIMSVTLIFSSTGLCTEESWNWTRPCVYNTDGQCTIQTTIGEVTCSIQRNEGMCEEADPVPWDKIPSKPEDFQAMWDTDIGVTDGGVSENHILVNMSWSIDVLRRYKPTGFHVSLMGLTDHGEYKYHYFRQTLCATFDLSEDNFTDIDGPTLQYFFDCFRPLSPYCDYQLVVRTLPYTDETSPDGQIGPHSTLHSERFRTPSCGDPEISKTAECQVQPGEEAAYWQPVHLTPYSPTYHKITAKFDLPPESYGIYEYKILIYRYTVESSRCSGYVATETVDKNDTRVSIYNDTVGGRHYTFLEYTLNGKFDGRHYCMKMTPGPDDACTIPDKGIDRCRTTTSEGFEVLGNNSLDENPLNEVKLIPKKGMKKMMNLAHNSLKTKYKPNKTC